MENALVYAIDDNADNVRKMVNSINSFVKFNSDLVDSGSIKVFILSANPEIDLSQIDEEIEFNLISRFSYDYSKVRIEGDGNWQTCLRYEIFANPEFWDIDNLLYLDCDTEFRGSIKELFVERTEPGVWMVNMGTPSQRVLNDAVILTTPRLFGSQKLYNLFYRDAVSKFEKSIEEPVNHQRTTNSLFTFLLQRNALRELGVEYNWEIGMRIDNPIKIMHHAGDSRYALKHLTKRDASFPKNGLVYAVDGEPIYVKKMVNSANSLFAYNQNLIDTTMLYIVTDSRTIDLSGLNPNVKYAIVSNFSKDYKRFSKDRPAMYFKWEMLLNPMFSKLDNLLYVDADTMFVKNVEELFRKRTSPAIGVVPEKKNNLTKFNLASSGDRYFNTGLVLLTPKLIGRGKMAELFNQLEISLKTNVEWEHGDQDVFNLAASRHPFNSMIEELGPEYNLFNGTWDKPTPPATVKMVHFAGNKNYELMFLNK